MTWLTRLSDNQRLALAAFALGAGALFAHPTSGAAVRMDPQELALIAERGADRIAPATLADWIIQGRADYRLLDLRDAGQYAAYHIPTAENVPMSALPAADIARNERVILYSDDGARSIEGWVVLRARGVRNVYTVSDGIQGWSHDVLFPVVSESQDPQTIARLRAVSSHFGGGPLSAPATSGGAAVPELPPAVD